MVGTYDQALIIAGACTLIAVTVSVHLVNSHLKRYVNPQRQRYVIRILWMVPIYALDSFLSLCFISLAVVFEVPRDVYESYVIYNFLALMIDIMGGEDAAREFFAQAPPQKHWWPFGWMGAHDMTVFLETCRLCTLQYSVVRPITAIVTLTLTFQGLYDDSDLSWTSASLWILILNNSSVTLALYYLIYFYHSAAPRLHSRPLAKFLAVKSVVFFCFWQYTAIAVLGSLGLISRRLAHRSEGSTETGLTDFIVCVEMAFFAIIHEFVFPVSEHSGELSQHLSYDQARRDMFFIGDVKTDLGRIVKELPMVLYYGFSQVKAASDQRTEARKMRKQEKRDESKTLELPPQAQVEPPPSSSSQVELTTQHDDWWNRVEKV